MTTPTVTPIMGDKMVVWRSSGRTTRSPISDRRSPLHLNRIFTAKLGADDLGLNNRQGVAVIQSLTVADFEKSMTSMADHRVWQDVYKPAHDGPTLYVKFTRDAAQSFLLISFKGA